MMTRVPELNLNVLTAIGHLCSEVVDHSKINKMTTHNLAVVFGPCVLFNPSDDPVCLVKNAKLESTFVSLMLES